MKIIRMNHITIIQKEYIPVQKKIFSDILMMMNGELIHQKLKTNGGEIIIYMIKSNRRKVS